MNYIEMYLLYWPYQNPIVDRAIISMLSEAEKRKHPRMKVSFDVEVSHPLKGVARYQTRDMSDTGMFVVSKASQVTLKEGEIVRVLIDTESFVEPMTIDMRVVRHSAEGKALTFI